MRTLALRSAAFGLALALFAAPVAAQHTHSHRGGDDNTRIIERQPLRRASSALQTRNGEVALLIVNRTLVMQLTDRGMGQIEREMREDTEDEGMIARFVGNIVRSGVRSMLDHGIEYPISEIGEARYENGRLLLTNRDGEKIFENVEINDTDVMENFSPNEARAFVARINQLRRSTL